MTACGPCSPPPWMLAEQLDLVEPVVAVGVADAVEAAVELAAGVDDDVEAIEGPEQALRLADRDVDRLDRAASAAAAPIGGGVTR